MTCNTYVITNTCIWLAGGSTNPPPGYTKATATEYDNPHPGGNDGPFNWLIYGYYSTQKTICGTDILTEGTNVKVEAGPAGVQTSCATTTTLVCSDDGTGPKQENNCPPPPMGGCCIAAEGCTQEDGTYSPVPCEGEWWQENNPQWNAENLAWLLGGGAGSNATSKLCTFISNKEDPSCADALDAAFPNGHPGYGSNDGFNPGTQERSFPPKCAKPCITSGGGKTTITLEGGFPGEGGAQGAAIGRDCARFMAKCFFPSKP